MRIAAVLPGALLIVALPAAALAQATVKCEHQGSTVKVVVTNPDDAEKQCSYFCKYARQFGEFQVSGATGVKAGASATVREETSSAAITGVKESSVTCR